MWSPVFAAIVALIGSLIIMGVATAPFSKLYRGRPGKRLLAIVGSLTMIVGATGFFGAGVSAAGGLNWLPHSFEWPVLYTNGAVTLPDGTHAVPLTDSNRVQLYDSSWHFIRGWPVAAQGGTFGLRTLVNGHVEVFTARGKWHYVYNSVGDLISSGHYSTAVAPIAFENGDRQWVPTRWWLWPFAGWFFSWVTVAIGMGLLAASQLRENQADREQITLTSE